MKLPCRGKYFFRNLWSSRIALRFTVSEWTQSRDWLSSSPGSCGLGKGEGASGTIRMFAAALIPTLEHGFSVAWFQIETKFYFGNHWMENCDFHVTIVQWKCRICDGSHRLAISSCDIKFKGCPEEFDVNWSNMQYPAKRMLDVCKCNSEICKSSILASFESISSRGEQQPSQF